MTYQAILGIVPGLMATGVVARNVKALPDISKGKLQPIHKPIKLGFENIIGVGLVGVTGKAINAL